MSEELKIIEMECKLCGKVTKHIDFTWNWPNQWKCMSCGEYNFPCDASMTNDKVLHKCCRYKGHEGSHKTIEEV